MQPLIHLWVPFYDELVAFVTVLAAKTKSELCNAVSDIFVHLLTWA